MITISQLTELFGWAAVINIGYIVLTTLIFTYKRGPISTLHSKMLDIDEKELGSKYFDFLSMYKVVTLVLIVAPYIALKIMGQ